jgi:hypothetical protein
METVNNVVNSASKLIWGEGATQSGEEPVSGQKGAGTANEPYDKGNTTGGKHSIWPHVDESLLPAARVSAPLASFQK